MDNIFQIGGQVFGDSFIGREEFIRSIRRSYIESSFRAAKSIVGLTRMGKSSAVKNCFLDLPPKILYIYEDLNEWTSYNEIWQDICYELKDQIIKNGVTIDPVLDSFESMECNDIPWVKLSRSVKRIFEYLSDSGLKCILVLDEFDNASNLFTEGTKHFELFRTIFSDGRYNVSSMTISRRNLYTIEGATYQSSTFHGVMDIIPFKGFDDEDMKMYFDVFSKYGIQISDIMKGKIIYYAGNAPYLLSIMGHYIIEAFYNGEEIDVDRIFLDKCKAINDYYRDCIKHLERDGDLERIIPFLIGPNIGVTQNDKDELFNLGYFRDDDGKLIAISEYFVGFLSANMLRISIWDNIISLEKKLKQLIERELTRIVRQYSAAGESFNDVFKEIMENTPGIEISDISRYDSFISNNKKIFSIDSTYLDVMSMNDAIKIIKGCWEGIFSAYFNNDLYSEWENRFNRCARARNPVAHGHEEYLSNIDKQELDVYCKQIFDTLSITINQVEQETYPFMEVAKANLKERPIIPKYNYEDPIDNLLGNTKKMLILEIGGVQKNNLRGVIDEKYRAVITKNYLVETDLRKMINQTIDVKIERINNGRYEVKPLK